MYKQKVASENLPTLTNGDTIKAYDPGMEKDRDSANNVSAAVSTLNRRSESEDIYSSKLPPVHRTSPLNGQNVGSNGNGNKRMSIIASEVDATPKLNFKQVQSSVDRGRKLNRSKSVVNVLKIHSPDPSAGNINGDAIVSRDSLPRINSEFSLVGDGRNSAIKAGNHTDAARLSPRRTTKVFGSDTTIFQRPEATENGYDMTTDDLLSPDHPLMKRYQDAIKTQLLQQKEQLRLDLKDAEGLLKRTRNEYQNVGGEVYGMKQELDKLSRAISQKGEQLTSLSQERHSFEEHMEPLRQQMKEMKIRIDELLKAEKAAADELRRLNIQVNVAANDTETTNHMLIAKNAVKKAKEDLAAAEKEKTKQDDLVSHLGDTVARKEAELQALQNELQNFLTEMMEKRQRLLVVNAESQSLSMEKRNLFQRWNTAVKGIRRRDEELAEIQKTFRNHQQNASKFESELISLAKAYSEIRQVNELLIGNVFRLQDDIDHCMKLVDDSYSKGAAVEAEIIVRQHEVEDLGTQRNSLRQEKCSLTASLNGVLTKLRVERNEIAKLDDYTWNYGCDGKGSHNALVVAVKELGTLKREARDLESTCNDLQRELERESLAWTEIDSNTQTLKKSYEECKDEMERNRISVERLQHDLQRHVSTYDRKVAQAYLLQQRISVDKKPPDVSVDLPFGNRHDFEKVQKDMMNCDDRVVVLQREWIKLQDQLIKISELIEKEGTEINQLTNAHSELESRNIRLQAELRNVEEEQHQIGRETERMHIQISKHNSEMSKLVTKPGLENDASNIHGNIAAGKIRAVETECVQLEEKLTRKVKEKQDLERNLQEAEGQLRVWEEKTSHARMIKETIDQSQGDEGYKRMLADVHRMQTRIGQLNKLQENAVKDMEKSISKRHVLLQKGEAVYTGRSVRLTQAQLDWSVTDLRKKLKQLRKDLEAAEKEEDECKTSMEKLASSSEVTYSNELDMMRKLTQLNEELELLESIHFKNSYALAAHQMRHKRFEDARDGKYEPSCEDVRTLEIRRNEEEKKRALLAQLVNGVRTNFPACVDSLRKIEALLTI